MNRQNTLSIQRTSYDRTQCKIGFVHLGFGAFHRAHQAVYIDDYMDRTGDLRWGIAGVNLRPSDRASFQVHSAAQEYLLKTTTPQGESTFKEIRSHIHFEDWSEDPRAAEGLLALDTVKAVTITVTESGYYLNDDWGLNTDDPVIEAELTGGTRRSVYAYLSAGLKRRMDTVSEPITVLCCDNIRSNGQKLQRNFLEYVLRMKDNELHAWVKANVTFPNSMVDRITPRATAKLTHEIETLSPSHAATAIHAESFSQWVLQDTFATDFPTLMDVGVEVVEDVDPYEEAKIRILNGGHTALCYLGALAGYQTFDETMVDPALRSHFDGFESQNVLPGLTIILPFDKARYVELIAARFSNSSIADDLARICMDGWSKFPIFIYPTLKSCLAQGIDSTWTYDSIASWYLYARRVSHGQTHIPYNEPYWDQLEPLTAEAREADFARTEALWFDLPETYPNFVTDLTAAIARMEEKWPV
ncbi:MAG: mannitol dehydrogenase family protein [Pseudomonadota bacterium]